ETTRAQARVAVADPISDELDGRDLDCLRALVAGFLLVAHLRALGQRAKAVAGDAAVVDEKVPAALVRRDEAVALVVAEPLDRASCHAFPPRRDVPRARRPCCATT